MSAQYRSIKFRGEKIINKRHEKYHKNKNYTDEHTKIISTQNKGRETKYTRFVIKCTMFSEFDLSIDS